LYNRQFNLVNDNFQNLYLNLIENTISNLIKNNPIIYDYQPLENIICNNQIESIDDIIIESYLKKIYHLVTSLFGDMTNYTSNNITYYKYNKVPSLYLISNYLNKNNNELINKWSNEINQENIKVNYFNSPTSLYLNPGPNSSQPTNIGSQFNKLNSKIAKKYRK
jgi:hypothetical protein